MFHLEAFLTPYSTEARAFGNHNQSGLDFWTPNINPYKDPRWGRGQETPGEDPLHLQQYVYNLIVGLQGGVNPQYKKIVSTCKHFAGYDMENVTNPVTGEDITTRHEFNAVIGYQDLVEYYLPPFQTCARDAQVGAVMCAYNALNGYPSCADPYLLQTILREHWGWSGPDNWITSDCDAVDDVFNQHNFTDTAEEAAAAALSAGTDLNCGTFYKDNLPKAFQKGLVTEALIDKALTRLYSSQVKLGFFDPPEEQPYRALGWSDVATPEATALAYKSAIESIVLLKNDGTLPLSTKKSVALIGPWANATIQLKGNYAGIPPFLHSPLWATQQLGVKVGYAFGTGISEDVGGFSHAISTAKAADAIIFLGGIDNTIEAEAQDRIDITWPGNQLELIKQLSTLGKPLVVAQMGGGQVDDTALVKNKNVNSIIWGGYPGQDGGTALIDIIFGKEAPAGRLPITQYPEEYVKQLNITQMALRPSKNYPGRTYKWYTGKPIFEFGHGLHYTTFSTAFVRPAALTFSTAAAHNPNTKAAVATFTATIKNTGKVTSDYVALAYISTTNAGPGPYPKKSLVAYERVKALAPGKTATASFTLTTANLVRADLQGNSILHPGKYTISLDGDGKTKLDFELVGEAAVAEQWPQQKANGN